MIFFFKKGAKIIQWENIVSSTNGSGTPEYSHGTVVIKNELRMDHRVKYELKL